MILVGFVIGMLGTILGIAECSPKEKQLDLLKLYDDIGVIGKPTREQLEIIAREVYKSNGDIVNTPFGFGSLLERLFTEFPLVFDFDKKLEIVSMMRDTLEGDSLGSVANLSVSGLNKDAIMTDTQNRRLKKIFDTKLIGMGVKVI